MFSPAGSRARVKSILIPALAFLGAVNCVVMPIIFAQYQEPLFPWPGLYLIEIALLGLLGLVSSMSEQRWSSGWGSIPWIVSGSLLVFVIFGAWTIGLFLIPATFSFLIVGFLDDRKQGRKTVPHLGRFLGAAVIQAAIFILHIFIS